LEVAHWLREVADAGFYPMEDVFLKPMHDLTHVAPAFEKVLSCTVV